MQSKFLLVVALFSLPVLSFSQAGILSGKILDAANNQPLAGATVTIKDHSSKTLSDIDGIYKLGNLPSGKYTIQVSYVGYITKEITEAEILRNQVTNLNITLDAAQNTTLQAVIVTTEARKESINSILTTRRNAAVVSDAISADIIKKSPDKNISDVLKRISGTSIQDNKFVIIRGMSDRYNEALLNGAMLPSTEADRKTFAFDIFPAQIVDNITVIKSALPEYPGSFAGGLVEVNLKDVTDKNFIEAKIGTGFNTITAGKPYYHANHGSSDWIGLDDGTRELPSAVPSTIEFNSLSQNKQIQYAKQFPNDWNIFKNSKAGLNTNLQLAGAFNKAAKNGYPKFGGIFGLSYNSSFRFSKMINRDYGSVTVKDDSIEKGQPYYDYQDSSFTQNILSSGLANFSLKVNPNTKIFFNNLLTINSTIKTVVRNGTSNLGGNGAAPYYAYIESFQSNVLYNSQLGAERYFPNLKLRVKALGYYTKLHRNEPDYRQMIYFQPFEGQPFYAYLGTPTLSSTTVGGTRFYYVTDDEAKGANLDFNKSFKLLGNQQAFKFGYAYYYDTRVRDGRFIRNDQTDENFNQELLTLPSDAIFAKQNFDARTGFVLTDFAQRQWYYYRGNVRNDAGYVMFDNKFTQKLRLAWGLRVENYTNEVHSYQSATKKYTVDTTFLDYLPSANFIYSVLPKANIRLSYGRTVVRPLYRELAANLFYDFILNATFFGSNLSETRIDNYEIRWEQYFRNAEYYSVSGFYKKFKDPIEQKIVIASADSRTITWQNAPSAENFGVEVEARKNFDFISPSLQNLYFYANAALIHSTAFVKGNGSDTANRRMFGQSPYVMNASLQYSLPDAGINLSALFNIIGERIAYVGNVTEFYMWEKPHPVLDFKASKTFLKKGIVEVSLSDILHKDDVFFWDINNNKKWDGENKDVLIISKSYGITASLTVGYTF